MWTVGKRKPVAPDARMEYRAYLRSAGWILKRKACIARAGHRCQACNGTQRLEVHHRTYERLGNELAADLICLCHWCHLAITARQKARAVVDFVNAAVVWVVTTFRGR